MVFFSRTQHRFLSGFLAFVLVISMVPINIPVVFAATITWNGGGDGSTWSDCDNWGGSCPGSADDAVIDTAVTVKITAATTINSLILGVSAGNVASILQFDFQCP